MFIVDGLKNKLKIYASKKNLGTVYHNSSTWFNGYEEKFFFDKGALLTAISPRHRIFMILQFLIRHREVLKNTTFVKAFKKMKNGSNDYMKNYKNR